MDATAPVLLSWGCPHAFMVRHPLHPKAVQTVLVPWRLISWMSQPSEMWMQQQQSRGHSWSLPCQACQRTGCMASSACAAAVALFHTQIIHGSLVAVLAVVKVRKVVHIQVRGVRWRLPRPFTGRGLFSGRNIIGMMQDTIDSLLSPGSVVTSDFRKEFGRDLAAAAAGGGRGIRHACPTS